jgi:hypothetical protein
VQQHPSRRRRRRQGRHRRCPPPRRSVDEFYRQCDPERENLCLYGYPDGQWAVDLPAEEVPPEAPELHPRSTDGGKTWRQVSVVPNGEGPRDHPLLKDLNLPALGQAGRAAPLLTKSFLFIGEGDKVGLSIPKLSGGNMFRAYDKKTGKVAWQADLGAGTTSPPITYMHKGKQYIVVGVGGVDHPAELVALSLN